MLKVGDVAVLGVPEMGQEQPPNPRAELGFAALPPQPQRSPSRSAPGAVRLAGGAPIQLTHFLLNLFFIAGAGWISWLPPHPGALVLTYSRDVNVHLVLVRAGKPRSRGLDAAVYLLVNQSPLCLYHVPRESSVVAFNLRLLCRQLLAPLPRRV